MTAQHRLLAIEQHAERQTALATRAQERLDTYRRQIAIASDTRRVVTYLFACIRDEAPLVTYRAMCRLFIRHGHMPTVNQLAVECKVTRKVTETRINYLVDLDVIERTPDGLLFAEIEKVRG